MTRQALKFSKHSDRQTMAVAAIVVLQALGAIFFLADAMGDIFAIGFNMHIVIESIVSFALFAGVVFGAQAVNVMLAQARQRDEALAIASGALADLIRHRFAAWKLTKGEADVAMFALKGCTIAQIAELRGTAEGTVRAQLARVYAKANVTNQTAFVCLFFEDLLDIGNG
ncbi:helix-turn-helix transcriptional regulator [Aquisediminimonas sediminicola]|uniref:helix-turn-helix transcriptional regulator n=1 Tax=Alteraquisediminimonas sediminicola TaxID=2676787 RepID=UPI001FEA5005|nr:LuxR C-terminal-related transcriptional regulator [Aquisediminimonas sediminicola]